MMIVPAGVKVHLALGYTDMRKGMDGLAMLVQETLKKDPFSGHLFAFRGKRASDHQDPVKFEIWAPIDSTLLTPCAAGVRSTRILTTIVRREQAFTSLALVAAALRARRSGATSLLSP